MKIATITCHDVYNYGASLQAYALQEYCRSLGCDYEIINYRSSNYGLNQYLFNVNNNRFKKPLLRELYILFKLPSRIGGLKRKKRFDEFTRLYLKCSKKTYYSNNELLNGNIVADLFIAGSDQIWNTILKNGRDKAYYLDFALNNGGRRISYAGSFGTEKIYNGAENFIKNELSNFDSISVREYSAACIIENMGHNVDQVVCDPVFLLRKEDWHRICMDLPAPKEEYIVVYDCEISSQLKMIAQQLKKELKLPIYSLSKSSDSYADQSLSSYGPLEFVKIISHAKLVVANSFHALAFSIIFNRDFVVVNRFGENNNVRMSDFLKYINLSNRLINCVEDLKYTKIDWGNVDNLINKLVDRSKQYLSSQISLAESK